MPRAITEAGLARAVAEPAKLADAVAQSVRAPAEQG
jgi:chemotaxis response regulator CheB